jgi:ubiquinol-cytochrome c reductase cytochrome b subunit
VRQVIQGGGNMPAYGKNLSPEQIRALTAFLVSLRPPNSAPAQDSAMPEKPLRASTEEKASASR